MDIRVKIIICVILGILMSSCQAPSEWQRVEYDHNKKCKEVGTKCQTSHQGEHELSKCTVYIDNDTLFIHFPAELPAYWGSLTIKIHNGNFNVWFDGIPFILVPVSYVTVNKKLIFDTTYDTLNDTLCGYCDFTFEEINPDTKQRRYEFYFRGTITEVIRDKAYNPFDEKNFITFDLPTAIHELGEPLDRETFNTLCLSGFRTRLSDFFPANKEILIEELTWDISENRDVSDEGKERLTIWYAWKNGKQIPVHFYQWTQIENTVRINF